MMGGVVCFAFLLAICAAAPVDPPSAQGLVQSHAAKCPGKKCKPEVTQGCKGRMDACRNEAECCELDKCNIWQHAGRDKAAVLVFYASWCPVSRDFMLPYDLLRAQYEPFDNVLISKIDADENGNLVGDFGIEEYPSIIFMRRDCYWSNSGCSDPMMWRKYNGTSNEFEFVNQWIQQQLSDETNSLAFKQLPDVPTSLTGCDVSKVTSPPEDMRGTFDLPAQAGQPLLPPANGEAAPAPNAALEASATLVSDHPAIDMATGEQVQTLLQEDAGVKKRETCKARNINLM